MLSQEVEEKLSERLVTRINDINTLILQKIGKNIKALSTLSSSEAYQLRSSFEISVEIMKK